MQQRKKPRESSKLIESLVAQELEEEGPLLERSARAPIAGLVPPPIRDSQLAGVDVPELSLLEPEELEPRRPAKRQRGRAISIAVLAILLAGLLVMVWDTRREVGKLSSQLESHNVIAPPPTREPAAAAEVPAAARTFSLTFGTASSIGYSSPVAGMITDQPAPGQLLEPGDLIAEITNARDYRRLVKARQRHRALQRRAKRDPTLRGAERDAMRQAVRVLKKSRMTYVHAAQHGIARPTGEPRRVKANEALVQLDDPTVLAAELPVTDIGEASCRFTGEAADAKCTLVVEKTADDARRVRVLMQNEARRILPGQTIEVVLK